MDKRKRRLNWHVTIACVDCGAEYRCNAVTASTEVLGIGGVPVRDDGRAPRAAPGERFRMLLVTAPNECPKCHSIHPVIDQEKFRKALGIKDDPDSD